MTKTKVYWIIYNRVSKKYPKSKTKQKHMMAQYEYQKVRK